MSCPLVQEQLRGAILVADEEIEQSIVVDVAHAAVCVLVAGSASPLAAVTSVNVPSQLFRNSELRCGTSHPPRSTRMSLQPSLL